MADLTADLQALDFSVPPTSPRPRRDSRSRASAQAADAAPSICRICRGEGTAAEPLFYPCKCSGSIKYVHQDCLMEWLSHSQKKYCELCKTPFRFTKLYAPDMPKSLPVHVFLEHMARYLLRNLLVWLRAAVTISVWICWLPYFMRSVWSFMFWVSDEGLGGGPGPSRANETGADASWPPASVADDGTCPASPLFPAASTTSAAQAAAVLGGLDGGEVSDYLVRMLLGSLGMPVKVGRPHAGLGSAAANASLAPSVNVTAAGASTLLGNVDFLRNLTRSPTLNRTVVTVLEGQVITVLVIVCFILVILVRDYVVQQQPEINIRAAIEENLPPGRQAAAEAAALALLGEPGDSEASDDETLDDGDHQARAVGDEAAPADEPQAAAHPRPADAPQRPPDEANAPQEMPETDTALDLRRSNSTGDENPDERASVIDYLRIYRRAGGDSERILQIVEEEGLEDKLGYWVDVTRRSITKRDQAAGESAASSGPAPTTRPNLPDEAGSSRDMFDPVTRDFTAAMPASSTSKGKEREAFPELPEPESPGPESPEPESPVAGPDQPPWAGPWRPRAVSDGPRPEGSLHPLGSNNWTFAGLPPGDNANGSGPKLTFSPAAAAGPTWSLPNDASGANGSQDVHQGEMAEAPRHPDDEADDALLEPEPNPAEEAPAAHAVREPAGLVGRVAEFMWGDLDAHQNDDDEHNAGQDDAQADDQADDQADAWVDVPMDEGGADDDAAADVGDADGAAAGAALDAEAMEDMEDFEGVMELVGMRGPIAGLFQNAIFCAVLVSVTIFACIFIPYNLGRVALWVLANPMQVVRILFEFSKVIQDLGVMAGGFGSWAALNLVDLFTGLVGGALGAKVVSARKASWGLWTAAGSRIVDYALRDFPMSASEMHNFSAISHAALMTVKSSVASGLSCMASLTASGFGLGNGTLAAAAAAASSAAASVRAVLPLLLDPSSWVIDLGGAETRPPVDPELAYWPGLDRFWAILAGYATIFAVGALYLKRGTPFSRGIMMQAWEAGVMDTLHQASGIMKVILIISIEMLVFPLYCGLLLDAALLPLFEKTTVRSRVLFTCNYPLTSVFVHWFVGTGYMFHFALFVSMCRKIMRPGVLYFIRDPDDPEFHPVRDVLERSLMTQLRKILFSAFVYGALVIVCLGGVVWSLAYGMPGVLPIHYSSNEPVLEFPVDLLFYNFLMPMAVKVFRSGDGLHAMYTWWFRKCARGLRLTYFLFGERRIDEEGTMQLSHDSPARQSRWKRLFLELDGHDNKVVPKTWRDTFEGGDAKPNPPASRSEERSLRRRKRHLVVTGQLVKSGRFVRAPASDRVKIPKGRRVFLNVTELGRRKDGKQDNDIYASSQYQMVYVPPNFRLRILLFILFIWLFAAVTGVGITVAPLALGRRVLRALMPEHIRTNDIYAFSIGIYMLGAAGYSLVRVRSLAAGARSRMSKAWEQVAKGDAARHAVSGLARGAKLAYAYAFLVVVFPLLFSTMLELYITIPLHTYMNPPGAAAAGGAAAAKRAGDGGRHTVRVIQAWTLGLLYLHLGMRMMTSLLPQSRAAIAVRAVVRRGWLRPDAGVLTRAFVVPGMAVAALATFGPPLVASALLRLGVFGARRGGAAAVYRYSYPAAAVAAVVVRHAVGMARVFHRWKAGIRDEAYLIGERLHNFGAAAAGARRARRAWGAGRPRL